MRSRSNSYNDMKLLTTRNSSGYYQRYYERPHEDNDPNKSQLFWDGFQWVIRSAAYQNETFELIPKAGRKLRIANLPLHIVSSLRDIKKFFIKKLKEKEYMKAEKKDFIRSIELNEKNNSAIVIMATIEDASLLKKLEGISTKYFFSLIRFSNV